MSGTWPTNKVQDERLAKAAKDAKEAAPLAHHIQADGLVSDALRSQSFADTMGVSEEELRKEQSRVRKAAAGAPDAAERVAIRFAKAVHGFKESEGRSPGTEDREVWQTLAQIVREESGIAS